MIYQSYQKKALDILTDHFYIVHKSESLLDHAYIKKTFMEKCSTNLTVSYTYFLDLDHNAAVC